MNQGCGVSPIWRNILTDDVIVKRPKIGSSLCISFLILPFQPPHSDPDPAPIRMLEYIHIRPRRFPYRLSLKRRILLLLLINLVSLVSTIPMYRRQTPLQQCRRGTRTLLFMYLNWSRSCKQRSLSVECSPCLHFDLDPCLMVYCVTQLWTDYVSGAPK